MRAMDPTDRKGSAMSDMDKIKEMQSDIGDGWVYATKLEAEAEERRIELSEMTGDLEASRASCNRLQLRVNGYETEAEEFDMSVKREIPELREALAHACGLIDWLSRQLKVSEYVPRAELDAMRQSRDDLYAEIAELRAEVKRLTPVGAVCRADGPA